MANIIFNIADFVCESPIIGDTYRNFSTTGEYLFNWTTNGDLYQSYGLNVSIKLFIKHENVLPEIEYTDTAVPFNATNFSVGPYNDDQTSFRLEFSIDGGTTCYFSIDIPYSSIIIN